MLTVEESIVYEGTNWILTLTLFQMYSIDLTFPSNNNHSCCLEITRSLGNTTAPHYDVRITSWELEAPDSIFLSDSFPFSNLCPIVSFSNLDRVSELMIFGHLVV